MENQNSLSAALGTGAVLSAVQGGSASIGQFTLTVPRTGFVYVHVTNTSIQMWTPP